MSKKKIHEKSKKSISSSSEITESVFSSPVSTGEKKEDEDLQLNNKQLSDALVDASFEASQEDISPLYLKPEKTESPGALKNLQLDARYKSIESIQQFPIENSIDTSDNAYINTDAPMLQRGSAMKNI